MLRVDNKTKATYTCAAASTTAAAAAVAHLSMYGTGHASTSTMSTMHAIVYREQRAHALLHLLLLLLLLLLLSCMCATTAQDLPCMP
jgi:hypothetical protein